MTNKEAFELYNHLNTLGELKGAKFAYGVSKNMSFLKSDVEAFSKAIEATKEYAEYDKKRLEILEKYAVKEDGKAVIQNNEYVLADKDTAMKEVEQLKEDNKEIVEAREKQLADFKELMEKECTVTPYKINIKDIPEGISAQQLYGLFAIIEE